MRIGYHHGASWRSPCDDYMVDTDIKRIRGVDLEGAVTICLSYHYRSWNGSGRRRHCVVK